MKALAFSFEIESSYVLNYIWFPLKNILLVMTNKLSKDSY